MIATFDEVYDSARTLPLSDLGSLINRLLGELSDSLPDCSDADLHAIADAREAEMESDVSATISHEQMLGFIQSRRR
jgi:hypothetical protein